MCFYCKSFSGSVDESESVNLTNDNFNSIIQQIRNNVDYIKGIYTCHTNFASKAAQIIAEALTENTHVLTLRLGNKIGNLGAEAIANMLKTNSTIKVIDLKHNSSLSLGGISAVANVLTYNTALTKLNLSGTNLKRQACESLGRMLKVNTTLKTLDISHNNFDTKGIRALLDSGLQYNRGLRKLSISNNGISLTGAIVLAKFMETNNTIEELDVSSNNFNSEGIIAFMRMLLINKTLTNVNFNNISTFNNDAVKSMSRMFESNTTLNTLTMINTYSYLENYWLLNTNWTTQLEVGLESNYSLTTFDTNIISSKISDILFNNKYRKLYITVMLLFSEYQSIVPSLVVKRIVDHVLRMPNF